MTPVTPRMAAGGRAELRLGHYSKDGIEVVTVEDETGTYMGLEILAAYRKAAQRESTENVTAEAGLTIEAIPALYKKRSQGGSHTPLRRAWPARLVSRFSPER